MKIDKPGVYEMPAAEYHADPCAAPSLSSSIAKVIVQKSPLHAWTAHPRLNPTPPVHEAEKFDIGSAVHAITLEGENRMAVIPFNDYRKDDAKNLRDMARREGRHPVLEARVPTVLLMRDKLVAAIERCPDLAGIDLKKDGVGESTAIWERDGVWHRSRRDWISHDKTIILDLKTTEASANPNSWVRTMLGMGGDMQGAFYLEGNHATGGPEDAKFVFPVSETEEPFAVSMCGLSPGMVDMGAGKVATARRLWGECMKSGKWPGYPARICWLEPPAWALAQAAEHEDDEAHGHAYDMAKLHGNDKTRGGFEAERQPIADFLAGKDA